MKALRVVIACGGTGGHLFPGLAVAETLKGRGHEVLLIVSEKEIDTIALKAHPDFRVEKVPSIGMPSLLSPAFVRFLRRSWEGFGYCKNAYRKFRPSVVLGMGGFTSTAPILAARQQKLPTFIHESNAIPGRANKLTARFATRVLLGFRSCAAHFPARECVVTGTPVRRTLGSPLERAAALASFHLEENRRTLLVMGGSQGASGINQMLFKCAPLLKDHAPADHSPNRRARRPPGRRQLPTGRHSPIRRVFPSSHGGRLFRRRSRDFARGGGQPERAFAVRPRIHSHPLSLRDRRSPNHNANVFVDDGAAEMQQERQREPGGVLRAHREPSDRPSSSRTDGSRRAGYPPPPCRRERRRRNRARSRGRLKDFSDESRDSDGILNRSLRAGCI